MVIESGERMSESPAGKGDKPRPIDRKGYDESKLWVNIDNKEKVKK